jgi:hypothetical protein
VEFCFGKVNTRAGKGHSDEESQSQAELGLSPGSVTCLGGLGQVPSILKAPAFGEGEDGSCLCGVVGPLAAPGTWRQLISAI